MTAYRVVVSWSDSAVICVEAHDADDAATRARVLVEGGRGRYPLDPLNASDFRADDVQALVHPDADDLAYLRENAEAWAEYQDEDDKLTD